MSTMTAVQFDKQGMETQTAPKMPDIIYVMGTGRSGTTILEIMLANNSRFTGVGEFKHVCQHAFIENRICSCGKTALSCERWSGVLAATGWDRKNCAEVHRLVTGVENHRRFPLLWAGLVGKDEMATYRRAIEVLYTSVAALSGSSVLIDSSKYQGRALALAKSFPGKVKVLCLTRSAAGLIAAFRKKDDAADVHPKSLVWIATYYAYTLFCMWAVKARLKERCLAVRFEDLQQEPQVVLDRIGRWSGYSLLASQEQLSSGVPFTVGHIVSGNRIRTKGKVLFERDPREPTLTGGARALAKVLEALRGSLGF